MKSCKFNIITRREETSTTRFVTKNKKKNKINIIDGDKRIRYNISVSLAEMLDSAETCYPRVSKEIPPAAKLSCKSKMLQY
jgi:hypothetical protein